MVSAADWSKGDGEREATLIPALFNDQVSGNWHNASVVTKMNQPVNSAIYQVIEFYHFLLFSPLNPPPLSFFLSFCLSFPILKMVYYRYYHYHYYYLYFPTKLLNFFRSENLFMLVLFILLFTPLNLSILFPCYYILSGRMVLFCFFSPSFDNHFKLMFHVVLMNKARMWPLHTNKNPFNAIQLIEIGRITSQHSLIRFKRSIQLKSTNQHQPNRPEFSCCRSAVPFLWIDVIEFHQIARNLALVGRQSRSDETRNSWNESNQVEIQPLWIISQVFRRSQPAKSIEILPSRIDRANWTDSS